jgi:hypothetical protein
MDGTIALIAMSIATEGLKDTARRVHSGRCRRMSAGIKVNFLVNYD